MSDVDSERDRQVMLFLEEIPDPRYDRCKLHRLAHVIYLALFGWLCGAKTWVDVWDLCDVHREFLIEEIHLKNGIPSVSTFRRCLAHVSNESMQRLLARQADAMNPDLNGKIIAIDGKSLRGSASSEAEQKAFHTLNAFITDNHTVLRQLFGDCKQAELTMIPELLDTLDVKGATLTMDALACQSSITETIISRKADYVIGLKRNQPTAYNDAATLFARTDICPDSWQEVDKGHGRIECRSYQTLDIQKYALPSLEKFAGVKSITRVNSVVEKQGQQSQEYRYYLSSHKADAKKIGGIIRAHWSIENSLHYVLDVVYGEDDSTIRKKTLAANTSLIRKICLNIIRAQKADKEKNKHVMLKALTNPKYAHSLIAQFGLHA